MFIDKTFYFYEKEYIYVRDTLCKNIQTLTTHDLVSTYCIINEDLDELIQLAFIYTDRDKHISKSDLITCIENSKQSIIYGSNTSVLKNILYFLDVHHIDWRVILSSSHLLLLLNYYEYAENYSKYVLNKDTYVDTEWSSINHSCNICETIGGVSLKHGKKCIPHKIFKEIDSIFDNNANILYFDSLKK